jgi:hypothetical protein
MNAAVSAATTGVDVDFLAFNAVDIFINPKMIAS